MSGHDDTPAVPLDNEAPLEELDRRAGHAATALRVAVTASAPRPVPLRARRAAPVLATAALLVVAAVTVLLVRTQNHTTTNAAGAPAPLYLVPQHVPDGFTLAAAVDTNQPGLPAAAAENGGGLATLTTDGPATSKGLGGPTTFVFGDANASDPLTRPMIAVTVAPGDRDLGHEEGDHDVTRNGRTIRLFSMKWWGSSGPEMDVASVILPKAGAVGVAARNLDEDQVAQVAAALPDADFLIPVAGSMPSPGVSARWQAPILAALPKGSKLLQMGSDAMRVPVFVAIPGQDVEKGVSALLYTPSGQRDTPSGQRTEGRTLAVTVRLGGEGRLASDRFFRGLSRAAKINGHDAWAFPAVVNGNAADDASAGIKAVEWVQDGHVVRVEGPGLSLDQVTAVAASLHQVSEQEWRQLAKPVLGASGSTPSPATGAMLVTSGTNRGVDYDVTLGASGDSPDNELDLCIATRGNTSCVGSDTASSSSSGSTSGPGESVPGHPMPVIPSMTGPAAQAPSTTGHTAGDPGSIEPALPAAMPPASRAATPAGPSSTAVSSGGVATPSDTNSSVPGPGPHVPPTAGTFPNGAIASFVQNPEAEVVAALALADVASASVTCAGGPGPRPVQARVVTPDGHPELRVIVAELPEGCTAGSLTAFDSAGRVLGNAPILR